MQVYKLWRKNQLAIILSQILVHQSEEQVLTLLNEQIMNLQEYCTNQM